MRTRTHLPGEHLNEQKKTPVPRILPNAFGGVGTNKQKPQQNRRKGILNIPLLRDRRRRRQSEGLVSTTAEEKMCLAVCHNGIKSVHPELCFQNEWEKRKSVIPTISRNF